jgi:hypothetical protein
VAHDDCGGIATVCVGAVRLLGSIGGERAARGGQYRPDRHPSRTARIVDSGRPCTRSRRCRARHISSRRARRRRRCQPLQNPARTARRNWRSRRHQVEIRMADAVVGDLDGDLSCTWIERHGNHAGASRPCAIRKNSVCSCSVIWVRRCDVCRARRLRRGVPDRVACVTHSVVQVVGVGLRIC